MSDDLASELQHYITTGNVIRKQHKFHDSNVGMLDSMIESVPEYFKKNTAGTYSHEDSNFETAFTALSAPSLEGKTQSAFDFDLRKAKVLYFVTLNYGAEESQTQKIYRCFNAQSRFLCTLTSKDICLLSQLPKDKVVVEVQKIGSGQLEVQTGQQQKNGIQC